MSDDLVKRLRHRVPEPGRPYKSDATVLVNPQGDEAADRIEELEATLLATCKREAATQARHDAKVVALEARADALAEANERLRSDIKRFELEHQTDHGCIETLMGERDALAEANERLQGEVSSLRKRVEAGDRLARWCEAAISDPVSATDVCKALAAYRATEGQSHE